ncbi:diguanylate cyclase domain-containing protein [Geminocystis herdmanii]|uniref:diguanylate cyclase domain-containing protein n=1 Tax=Geminocystis herdmanii TaxID=669359 RepID=UPI000348CDE8|nr:diguanylate cyclase [Geminocystis herdmanii]
MGYQVFNSTLSIVNTEIHEFLKEYNTDHPYYMALSIPYFRQKLITKVLNSIPNNHILVDESSHFFDDLICCLNLCPEQLVIYTQITKNIDTIVQDFFEFNITHNNRQKKPYESSVINWWIRVETTKPYATYYFGPFDSIFEAKENCHGYIEDLEQEKAENITYSFELTNPQSLTIINDSQDLTQENEELWGNLWHERKEKKYFENLFLYSPDSCFIIDNNGVIKVVNKNGANLLKIAENELINQSFNSFIQPNKKQSLFDILGLSNTESINKQKQSFFSLNLVLKDKSLITVSLNVSSIKDAENNIIAWYLSLHDMTQWQKIQNELLYQSRYDALTNLPNRRSLIEFLQNILTQGEKNHSTQFAVLFLDINKFKHINDFFGHLTADKLLINFAKRLISSTRKCDHVARLGGDEFIIILTHIHSAQEAKDCVHRVQQSLSNCFEINEQKIMISVSIGIVIGDFQTANFSNLLSQADIAMYQAKQNGQLYSMYHC